MVDDDTLRLELARAVRDACVQAALDACEDAQMAGLCWEGAWEAAIGAIRTLDVERIVRSNWPPEQGDRSTA